MQVFDLCVQLRQAGMDGFPDYFHIHLEVSVRKRVSHFVGESQRQVIVFVGKLFVVALDVARCLANDFKVPYHRVLSFAVLQECNFVHAIDVMLDALNRFENMAKVFRQAERIGFAHTGKASFITQSLKLSCNAPGVRTSTDMPSNFFNSYWIAPISKSVVSGVGSTSRSRSLSSVSLP